VTHFLWGGKRRPNEEPTRQGNAGAKRDSTLSIRKSGLHERSRPRPKPANFGFLAEKRTPPGRTQISMFCRENTLSEPVDSEEAPPAPPPQGRRRKKGFKGRAGLAASWEGTVFYTRPRSKRRNRAFIYPSCSRKKKKKKKKSDF